MSWFLLSGIERERDRASERSAGLWSVACRPACMPPLPLPTPPSLPSVAGVAALAVRLRATGVAHGGHRGGRRGRQRGPRAGGVDMVGGCEAQDVLDQCSTGACVK